jgi:hypothetical protein
MTNRIETQLPKILKGKLEGITLSKGMVVPAYDGHSLVNLPASICRWLEIPAMGQQPLAAEYFKPLASSYKKVILIVVDGLGLSLFQRFLPGGDCATLSPIWNRLVEKGELFALTSTAPSTTSTAITSLWTGQPPAVHGVIGYEMWLKEFGVTANMINHSASALGGDPGGLRRAGFLPETFLPVPTLGSHLIKNGVEAHAFQHYSIARSGLSMMLLPDVENHAYLTMSDMWVTLSDLISKKSDQKMYINVYWPDLDLLEHRFSPQDRRTLLEFMQFSRQLESILGVITANSKGDNLLLICADHGQISTPYQPQYNLVDHTKLTDMLTIMPTCENRLAFLYTRSGIEKALKAYIKKSWGDDFQVISSVQAIEAGLFGKGQKHPRLMERVGDQIVLAHGSAYLWWSKKESRQVSRHGGLSSEEMLIPFMAIPI